MIGFKKSDVKGSKYIIVEVSLKRDKSNRMKGLFLGCQPMVKEHTQLVSKDEEFIWLYRGENIHMLNTAHYDIMTFEIDKYGSKISYAAGTKQGEYIDRLKLIQNVYEDDNKTLKSGLIDVEKYTVPENVKKDLEVVEKKNITTQTNQSHIGSIYNRNRSGACNYSTTNYKKKEPSATVFNRTTKYPITPALDRMRAKVEKLRNGEYKPPKLPKIPADEEEKKEATKSKAAAADQDDDDFAYMGGMMC